MSIFEAIGLSKKKPQGVALVKIPKHSTFEEESQEREDVMEWYLNAYDNVPLINAIINVQADQAVQEFYFEGPNKKKLEKWADEVNLLQFFYNIIKNKLIFGDAYTEVVKEEGQELPVKLKILNPIWMNVYRSDIGLIRGYSQIIKNKKEILWGLTGNKNKDRQFKKHISSISSIVHFKNNVIGSSKYGRSAIRSMVSSIKTKLAMEKDLGPLLDKYVAPLIWAKVGSDEMPASEAAVGAVATVIKDLKAESEIVTSHLVDISVLDFNRKGMDIKTPLMHVEQQIISGGQVPPLLMGRTEANDVQKGAEVQLRSFGRHIKSIQRELKIEFEDYILVSQGLGTSEDKLMWTKAEEREWEVDSDIIRGLVTDGILTPQKANDLLPPRYRETLPKIDPLNQQGVEASGQQIPRPTQSKQGKKVTDKPNDPTKTTKNPRSLGKRVDKSERPEKK